MSVPTGSLVETYDGTSLNVSAFNSISVPTYRDGTCTYSRMREEFGAPYGRILPALEGSSGMIGAPVESKRTGTPRGVGTANGLKSVSLFWGASSSRTTPAGPLDAANTFVSWPNGACVTFQRFALGTAGFGTARAVGLTPSDSNPY